MKKMWKRVSAVLLAFAMCIMTLPLTAAAATGDYELKINTHAGHTYKVYQLLTGDVSTPNGENEVKLSNAKPGSAVASGTTAEAIISELQNKTGIELGNAAKALIAEDAAPVAEIVNTIAEDGTVTVKVNGEDITGTSATITVPGGYYVIVDSYTGSKPDSDPTTTNDPTTTISATMVRVLGDQEVTPKDSTVPDKPGKTVKKGETENVKTVSIGDELTYTLSGTIPDMDQYKEYKFQLVDTMSKGLMPTVEDSFTVELTNAYGEGTGHTVTFTTDTTTDQTTGKTTITFVLENAIQYKDYKGEAFKFDYTAVVTKDAELESTGVGALTNSVKVEYSSNPDQGGTLDGETAGTDVTVYTTQLVINKVIGGTATPLAGAEFKLEGTGVNVGYVTGWAFVEDENGTYYKLVDGAFTTVEPNDKNKNQYADTDTKYVKKEVNKAEYTKADTKAQAFVDDETGKVTFTGLGEGTYTLSEITTPDGYNTIDPIEITITFDEKTKTFSATTANPEADKAGQPATLTVDLNGYNVENFAGSLLPSTGGIGTTIFYVVGGILVVAAVVLLVTKKRMNRA